MTGISQNITSPEAKIPSDLHLAIIVTLCVTSVLTLIGNILTAVVLTFFIKTSSVPKYLILTLCVSDILYVLGPGALSLYSYFLLDDGLKSDTLLCNVDGWLVVFLRSLSTLCITVMSVDRLIHIVQPTWYKQTWNGTVLFIAVIVCWILSAVFASSPMLGFGEYTPVTYLSEFYCLFLAGSYHSLGLLFIYTVQIVVTMFFITASMCLMKSFAPNPYSVVIKNRNVGTQVLTSLIARVRETKQITYSLVTVIVLFHVAALPFWVMTSLDIFNVKYEDFIGLISMQLPVVSGLFNPLIYGVMWEQCRLGYIEMLEEIKYACCKREAQFHRGLQYDTDTGTTRSDRTRLRRSLSESSLDIHASNNSLGVTQFKPIELAPDELVMFEATQIRKSLALKTKRFRRQQETNAAPKPRIVSKSESDILEQSPLHSLPRAHKTPSNFQFQSILDLIEEMTEASKMQENTSENKVKMRRRTESRPWTSEPILDKTNDDITDVNHISVEIPDEIEGYPAPDSVTAHKTKSPGCMCFGPSECYEVRGNDRYINYLYKDDTNRPRPQTSEPVVFY